MTAPAPLTGLRVLELAGLAPGPFAGLLLADYGASVLRIDRPTTSTEPTPDNLTRHKSSVTLSLKSKDGVALFKSLAEKADVLIDPYRPGVLEKLGLGPKVLHDLNPRLIIARLTGYRRDGKYKGMAGHDINYIAVSGVLAMLGRKGEKPYAPGNLIGDFAGGGMTAFVGVLLALLQRATSGKGQVVEANMVDGAAYLASMPRFAMQGPMWGEARGENVLDGGCPWYDTYETSDGHYMSVGCLEPQFYSAFIKGLGYKEAALPERMDRDNWPKLKRLFEDTFKAKTRSDWEGIFDGTDACVAPVLSFAETRERGFKMRPIVDLSASPSLAASRSIDAEASSQKEAQYRRGQGPGVSGEGFESDGLVPGTGAEEVLHKWLGFQKGKQYDIVDGGHALLRQAFKSNL